MKTILLLIILWTLISIVVGLFIGRFIQIGKGEEE